jgi:voltage-gated potassium channel
MKGVIEEGLNVLKGHRFRVSLTGCSLDVLREMLEQIEEETARMLGILREIEDEIRGCYRCVKPVELQYERGAYLFPLDRNKDALSDARDRLADLTDKRRCVYNAFQEKHLLEAQSSILGGRIGVRIKDSIIFLLIVTVLVVLGIEAANFGAWDSDFSAFALNATENSDHGAGVFLEDDSNEGDRSGFPTLETGPADSNLPAGRLGLSRQTFYQFWLIDFSCCLAFLANFFFEMKLSNSRRWYWRTHWVDFLTSIPLPPAQILGQIGISGAELLRAGRVLRLLRLLRLLRAMRLFLFIWRGMDQLAEIFDVRLMKKSLFTGLLVLATGAVLVSMFGEKGEGHEAVDGFLPSLWWSFTTMVTGGFADIYNPQTLGGRLLTVFLVIVGMVLVGVFTATLTTILVGREDRFQSDMQNEVLNRMNEQSERTNTVINKIEARQGEFAKRFGILENQIQQLESELKNERKDEPEST